MRALLLLSITLVFPACEELGVVGDTELAPGVIKFHHDDIEITVPTEFEAGQPSTVSVATFGDGCVSMGETRVEVDGLSAVVAPWNLVPTPGADVVCTMILKRITHTVEIVFDQSGSATVTVRGWALPENESYEEEFPVVVLP